MTSVTGIIDECIACVTETYRFFIRRKIGSAGSGYGRCEVWSEYQSIAFSVKKFIKFFRWNSSYFTAEYFKIFKSWSFYIFISITMEDTMNFLLYFPFLAAFAIVNVSYTFRGVKYAAWFGPPVVMYCGFL